MAIKADDLKLQFEEGEEIKRPRYVRRDAAFMLSDLPEIDYIVNGVINTHSIGVFYGDGGTKKTFSMGHLGVCIALGKSWLGFEVKGCKVLIIDEESGELRLALRLGKTLRGEFGDQNAPIEFVSMAGFKLDKKDDLPEIQKLILESSAGLVIIDALADVMDGDENSKKDVQPVFNALRWLCETTGATIIVIHHSNKTGGFRGSTAIRNSLDFMYKIISDDGSDFITFKSEKIRDGKSANFTAMAHWNEDQFYLTPTEPRSQTKRMTDGMKYALKYLQDNGTSPLRDIKSAADFVTVRQAEEGVRALCKPGWGLAHRTNPDEKGRGVDAIFALTQEGMDYKLDE
jgi:hypothetical protein